MKILGLRPAVEEMYEGGSKTLVYKRDLVPSSKLNSFGAIRR